MKTAAIDPKIRFEDKVFYSPDGCHYFIGAANKYGYCSFFFENKLQGAHRVSYQLYKGPIGNLHVLHHCDNPFCVNPDHLFLGTNHDNVLDRVAKGRSGSLRGTNNRSVKLTEDQVLEIRALYKHTSARVVAERYNVSRSAIEHIFYKKNWRHI